MDEEYIKTLQTLLAELQKVIEDIKRSQTTPSPSLSPSLQISQFFDSVRPSLFGGKLTSLQVSGIEAKIAAYQEAGWSLSHASYGLATSYHETAQRMQPVREGLSVSDAWRKKNLRYYPYYGRGDVQLTWLANYEKADKALSLNGELVRNLDLALDASISAKIMVKGMEEGWFAGDKVGRHTLKRHLPDSVGTLNQYRSARRIINGTDKADVIAKQAIAFQQALLKAGY